MAGSGPERAGLEKRFSPVIRRGETNMKLLSLATGAALILAIPAAMAAAPATPEQAQTRALNLQQSQLARAPLVLADATPSASLTGMVPLNQVENVPERVATARVTDADGRVIGAVQKVEIENGKPSRIDIALIGSENTVALDAGSVRYDAANNVVATSESASRLLAYPRS
jgi:hypothetical protein